jgi:hypothetical protein
MMRLECEYESEVLAAVIQGRWPERVDPDLRAHAAQCEICSDVAVIAGPLEDSRAELAAHVSLPDSGRVWRMAQLRAQLDAAEAANRPITAAQVIAFVCSAAVVLMSFPSVLAWSGPAIARMSSDLALLVAEHSALALAAVAVFLLIPAAAYLAVGRD